MKHKKITLFATLVVLIATTTVIIIAAQKTTSRTKITPKYKTYFNYSADEINQIKHARKETVTTTQDNLNKIYAHMFDIIKFQNTQPTLAAKYYAHLLMAQNEAFKLAKNANIEIDSVTKTTDYVNCIFFPSECKAPDTAVTAETMVADTVTKKIVQRIEQDNKQTALFVKEMKPMADKWYRLDVITPEAGAWKTWHINSPNDFLPPPPPISGSAEDKKQIDAVKTALKDNTPDRIKIIKYWAGGSNTVTPTGLWLTIANDYMNSQEDLPFDKHLEINAVLATTLEDAMISCWNTKYTYQTDRPDMRDPTIKTIIQDPNFPSYTSGHSTISAAAATILSHYFPQEKEHWFTLAEEARNSRLWAGIHFPIDNEEGFKMGEKIGNSILISQ
jgi:hypothetical protein